MDPTLATFLGVLLGGGIASGTSFGLERVRARRDEKAAERREKRDARRAARLLAEELRYGRGLIERAQKTGHYAWDPPKRLIPAAAWSEYRADFALVAADEAWETVAAAFAEFDRLNWHVIDSLEEDEWTGVAERRHPYFERLQVNAGGANLDGALEKVDAALAILRDLMKG